GWTGLSTNATCQPKKRENSQVKTRGPASTLGVERAAPRCWVSNQRERPQQMSAKCLGWTAGRNRCCQLKRASRVRNKNVWLPGMDSNHELDNILKSRNLLILQSR